MAKLFYQGHGSFRLTAADGQVVYVDPYAGEGYDLPADLILVSHQHGDHNQLYASGDTSKTAQMETFADMGLDYAILCGDGFYNMGLEEAAECAKLVGAKHNIIIHVKPKALFDRELAEQWDAPNKLIIEPNEEIIL
jgi:L-ascorbate metabolism protein UlaG (beta-lactamase superfamily)